MSTWTLRKTFPFEASHRLPCHDGQCARQHGHSWRVTVEVKGSHLQGDGPQTGMLLDYAELSEAVRPLLADYLDHWHLNDTTGLAHPTSETLAQWLFEKLHGWLEGLVAVEIEETASVRCRYEP